MRDYIYVGFPLGVCSQQGSYTDLADDGETYEESVMFKCDDDGSFQKVTYEGTGCVDANQINEEEVECDNDKTNCVCDMDGGLNEGDCGYSLFEYEVRGICTGKLL